MLVVEYKNISTENSRFSWKIPIFSNFNPLVRARDIKISEKLFDIFKTHIKLPLLVDWEEKNFPKGIRCTLAFIYSRLCFTHCMALHHLHSIVIETEGCDRGSGLVENVGIATDTIMLLAHNKQLLLVYA